VLISDPLGMALRTAITDAQGKVQLEIPVHSTVTALATSHTTLDGDPFSENLRLSLFDVPDTDELYLHMNVDGGNYLSDPPTMEVNVTMTSALPGTEGASGSVDILCHGDRSIPDDALSNDFHGTLLVEDVQACSGAGEIEVWGFARGGWDYQSIYMNAGTTGNAILAANNTQTSDSSLFVEGIPAGAEDVRYIVWSSMMVDGAGLDVQDIQDFPASQEILTVEIPAAEWDHVESAAVVYVSPVPDIEAWAVRYGASVMDELHWNASEDLALFDDLSPVDVSMPSRPAITWQMANTGNLGDYVTVSLGSPTGYWTAYLPVARTGTVRFPELPVALSEYLLTPADDVYVSNVHHTDDLFTDGYTAFVTDPTSNRQNYNDTSIR
jgi:hypothetical protein